MLPLPLLLFLLAAVVATVAYLGWRREQRRREELFAFATTRGWSYVYRDDGLVAHLGAFFPLLREGNGRRTCHNVLRATTPDGAPCVFADYSYQVRRRGARGSTSTRTVRHAIAVATLPAPLPTLRLGPENVLTRLAGAVGLGDVEVESPEFNRRFLVRAEDRRHAFAVLHPRAIDFLLGQDLDTWEFTGTYLLASRPGRWAVADYERVAARLDAFVTLVPDWVWREARGEAGA